MILNKLTIYKSLGVPKLWRYHNNQLLVYLLVEGHYQQSESSSVFPCLPVTEIPRLIEQSQTSGQRAVVRLFKQRIQEILATSKNAEND
jgi:hypothetical protein